ncbi:transporter substrate-binding domain-containing protein [Pantoea sp. DY-15]|uniref:ATP-binding protein n=1 Tax=Pantoea sp. DY-15 TaxID=2871489 RepID=UPI001C98892D|nr:ATP-binding protein [Pantoea sp. DY-15]MBY4888831.1 transporter substrate-binding domain-containing protein [Pantoea sp. DY-15]
MVIRSLLITCALLAYGSAFAAPSGLDYKPPLLPDATSPELSDVQWRLIGRKRELVLALYGPARPPMTRIAPAHVLTGYIADFAWTTARSLGLTLRVLHYDDAEEAYAALDAGDVDTVFSLAGDLVPARFGPGELLTVAESHPVEVTRRSDQPKVRVAEFRSASEYSPGRLLASLDEGKVNTVTLPAGEAHYLTERNYVNSLDISRTSDVSMPPYRFVTGAREPLFNGTLRAAVDHLRFSAAGELLATRWDQNNLTQFISAPLLLTREEEDWLHTHTQVRVASSTFNPPFFLRDSGKRNTGIGPELLSLVSLRTGIQFRYVDIDDSQQLHTALDDGEAEMTAPLIWSRERTRDILMTAPFMFTPVVMVTRKEEAEEVDRAVLIPGLNSSEWFREAYPHASVTFNGNPALAMRMVDEGAADATLNTLISARYLMQGLYADKLSLIQGLPVSDAAIAFGVRRSDPELLGILNKTLALIPPDMVTNILTHWQSNPAAKFDTWRIYRTEFYLGAAGALFVIITATVWAITLRQQVRRTHQVKSRLRQEIQFRDQLINGPPRPVYVATSDGQIIHFNPAFNRYFGENASSRLSLSLFDTRHPLYTVWKACMKQPPSGNIPLEAEFTVEAEPGSQRQIRHWMTSFLENDDKMGGFIGGWQDVTEYLNMQSDLRQARTEAEEASQVKSRFLATMSHEIRTPLSAIIGLLELQVQEKRSDTELIRVAHESSLSLLALIGDVLDIARIESGKMSVEPRWFPLATIVNSVMQAFSGVALQKGLKLSLTLQDDGREVLADDNRLRQVLANLVSNAVKFTSEGEVRVSVVLSGSEPERLKISVVDTGPGIPASKQEHLFAPFEQAADHTAGGSGLGLAISREIATLLDGTLTLESMPGRGAAFTLDIPTSSRAHTSENIAPQLSLAKQSALRILVVDDHPANRLLIARQLTLLDHTVSVAEDGKSGLARWRDEKPDVILTDCSMPEMGGAEMTRLIRLEDSNVVIIGITADAQSAARERCLEAGMNECLFRPVKLSRLAKVIDSFRSVSTSAHDNLPEIWLDHEAMSVFMPDSPEELREFLRLAISETESDLHKAREAVTQGDMPAARKIFHRIAGTLRVTGIRKLDEQCAFLEELVDMEEDQTIIQLQISNAEEMIKAFRQSTH